MNDNHLYMCNLLYSYSYTKLCINFHWISDKNVKCIILDSPKILVKICHSDIDPSISKLERKLSWIDSSWTKSVQVYVETSWTRLIWVEQDQGWIGSTQVESAA